MRFGLRPEYLAAIREVISNFPRVEEVWLFGSRATGSYRPGSDIDLAVKGHALTFDDLLRLMNALDELELPYTFDVLHYDQLENQALREQIEQTGKRL